MKKSKNKKIKWYKICKFCKGKVTRVDEYGYPLWYINHRPVLPWEWVDMKPITVFCGPECSTDHYERERRNN